MDYWTSNYEIFIIVNDKHITVSVNSDALDAFKELVHRATNLWPDAPPVIKEFADLLLDGEIKQNYRAQDTSAKKGNKNEQN